MEAALQDAKERVWAADDSLEMTQDALSRESRARRAAQGDAAAMRTERDVAVRPHPEPHPDPNPNPNPNPAQSLTPGLTLTPTLTLTQVRRADAAESRTEEVERESLEEQRRLKARYRKSLQGFLE